MGWVGIVYGPVCGVVHGPAGLKYRTHSIGQVACARLSFTLSP